MGYQNAIDVTGNNLANDGTIGFKYSRATFGSLFANNIFYAENQSNTLANGTNPSKLNQVGFGTYMSSIDRVMSIGTIENTENASDLAIGGSGFFFVGNPNADGTEKSTLYATRVGNFTLNGNSDLIQSSTGLSLYGYLAEEDANGDFVLPEIPTAEEMINATQLEKAAYINQLEAISLSQYQKMLPKPSEALNVSGILNSQLGPEKLMHFELSDNVGEVYDVYIEFDRDFSMLDSSQGDNFEAYTMNITVKDSLGVEVTPIDPSSKTILFSPSGEILSENGTSLNNLSVELPSSHLTIQSSDIDENVHYTSPKSSTTTEIITAAGGTEKVPFTFEKIETGDWLMKPSIPESGDIAQISLKNDDGEYIVAGSTSEAMTAAGVRMTFDSEGNITSALIVDSEGNSLGEAESIVLTFSDESTQEIAFNADDLTQVASASDLRINEEGGRLLGILRDFEFSSDGYLLGNYSNETQVKLAFIPISRFRSPEALGSSSSNPLLYGINYEDTGAVDSNFYGFFEAGQGMTGSVIPKALEYSNVDISKEMVNLIKYQRAMQLNSRTVQTADQILQQAIQLKD